MNTKLVNVTQITRGDEFLLENEIVTTKAIDMPGNGTVAVWVVNSKDEYETLYRRVEELVECPIYG